VYIFTGFSISIFLHLFQSEKICLARIA